MIRKISCLFVLLVAIMATGCATTGYLGRNPYPGPLGQVMAGNLALTCPGDYFVGPPINRCLRSLGGNMGRYSNYPMYRGGLNGPQLSPTDKMAVFCGLGASGLAALLDASLKKIIGASLVSAASCEVAGVLVNRRARSQEMPQQPKPKSPTTTRAPSSAEIQPTCPSGQVMFRNDTGSDVDVSAPGVPMFIMVAGGNSCRDWVSGLQWDAHKHSTMTTEGSGEATGSRLVMNPTAVCFEGDARGVIHLRNSCSR